MLLYMIKSTGNNYLKNYQVNGNDTFTATWTSTASNAKVFFSWKEASDAAAAVGGTILTFKLQ